ncbi:MAG: hypothetical protein HFJ26_01775 [Clostridia bacterium]|nr:hypothetical protein [Clostridia bacterium]
MTYEFNVENKREMIKLNNSKRFPKYPTIFLSNTCQVRVNQDDYFENSTFTIQSKYRILPRKIYLYGKRTRNVEEDNIYLNYWSSIFLKTIEKGKLYKHDFEKSNSKLEMCIGLPSRFREKAFRGNNWTKKNIIAFLSCLFATEIQEADFEQQDFLENLLTA